jgi:hypothetical protein
MRRVCAFVGAILIAGAGILGPVAAVAVPPGGAVENPLGGSVTLQPTTVAAGAKLAFAGQGYEPAERVTIKLDDGAILNGAGSDVFATVDAAGDGTFSGLVDLSTVGSAWTAAMSTGIHNVRLLSSSPKGARSIHVDFEVTAPSGGAPGTGAGSGTGGGSGPGAGSGGGSGAGGGSGTGGGGETGAEAGGGATAPARGAVQVIATRLVAKAGQVAVRLRGGASAQWITASLVSRDRLRVGGKRRVVTLAKPHRVRVGARATLTVRLSLTRAAKTVLISRRALQARLGLAPSRGARTTTTVTLRR